MVGFVLVSHSETLAEGAKELGLMMAPSVPVAAAGGLEDGGLGTDYEKIYDKIKEISALSPEGVILIMDMGSSVMTAEMVLEDMGDRGEGDRRDLDVKIVMADCPFVEGTVAAMVSASLGSSLDEVKRAAEETRGQKKIYS